MNSNINKYENKQLELEESHDIILYEKLFRQYYKPLIRFAYRYVYDETIAENVIHDVFLYLWNERDRLDFAINIKAYLYNAVKNRCLKYIRSKEIENKYKILNIAIDKENINPENILMNKELEVAISDTLNKLPQKRREIFVMNRFDRLTYSEIASILNISIKTVETQMSRSLKFLLLYVFRDNLIVKGLEFQNAASFGIYTRAENVTYENVHVHNCYLSGIYFYKYNYGLVENCVVHDFFDYSTDGGIAGGNADGLGSSSGNDPQGIYYGHHTFKNNIIYNCSDDGLDVWTSRHNTIKNNILHHIGYSNYSNGGSASVDEVVGDGNGYKLGKGGYNTVTNNVAYDIRSDGFESNLGKYLTLYNNTAYKCKERGFCMYDSFAVIKNNIQYEANECGSYGDPVDEFNNWNLDIDNPQFLSTDPWSVNFLHLSSGSSCIDAGIDVGIPYNGSALI